MITAEQKNRNMKMFGFGYEAMKSIKICSRCGKPASTKRLFCKKCGAILGSKTLFDFYKKQHTVCRSCNAILPNGSHFCSVCGASRRC